MTLFNKGRAVGSGDEILMEQKRYKQKDLLNLEEEIRRLHKEIARQDEIIFKLRGLDQHQGNGTENVQ